MNARERADYERQLREYKSKDKIAYPKIMKACRVNPKTKSLCETANLKTANEILIRLRQRYGKGVSPFAILSIEAARS
jgi:hypothetical protein